MGTPFGLPPGGLPGGVDDDAGGPAAEVTPEPDVATDATPATNTAVTAATEGGGTPETTGAPITAPEAETAVETAPDDLVGALDELTNLFKTAPPATAKIGDFKGESKDHPALKDMEWDADYQEVKHLNQWWSPEALLDHLATKEQLSRGAAHQSEVEHSQKVNDANTKIVEASKAYVSSVCGKLFPGFTPEDATAISERVFELADAKVTAMIISGKGDLDKETLSRAVADAARGTKAFLARFGKMQASADADAAKTQPVGGDGVAAVTGSKSYADMTEEEQQADMVGKLQRAKAQHGREY